MMSCEVKETSNSKGNPNFKIGKQGFEKALQKEFKFEKLSVGTYFTKKNGVKTEKGLNLTIENMNLSLVSDSLIMVYSDKIKQLTSENLLHLKEYDYINITFNQQQETGELQKVNSVKIRKQL
jgi:hypothetical protein